MASPFRPAVVLLAQYAAYHRDRRNILTHLVGVPLIVFALGVLLARGGLELGGFALSWAWFAAAPAALWYLTRGHLGLGVATTLAVATLLWAAQPFGEGSLARWLAWGLGLFGLGWTFQSVGHYYEGRKPAFADDIAGLLVGPMFVVMELLALAGLVKGLMHEIERRAGPTYLRDLAHPAT